MKKFLCYLLMLSLFACSSSENKNQTKTVTIKKERSATTLYYSGTIQPLKSMVVTTPAEGVVIEMPFQYGEVVNEGQLLFMVSSSKFLTDYKTALLAYVKAKSEFNTAQMKLTEAKFLFKNELIPADEYKTTNANFYTAQLSLIQAKDTLESLLQQLAERDINLESLSIANIDKITAAMHLRSNAENLKIIAPASGIILASNKSDEENKKVLKGDAIKQGDVLAIIGDMSGLSVRIKVNELTVNQLKMGQKVRVTGIAFPEEVLTGYVKRIDRQGESNSGGLPSFSAEVVVPKLTNTQQKKIHVGMSAKVEIAIHEEQQILIPIAAINEKNGLSFVKIFDDKSKRMQEVEVKTGKTTPNAVTILAGVNEGDKVVIPN